MDDITRRAKKCVRIVRKASRMGAERMKASALIFDGVGRRANTEEGRDEIAKAFVTVLEHRQKTSISCMDFQRNYYYIALNGRLAYVPRKYKNGLILNGKIVNHKATCEIKQGKYVARHRPIIDALDRERRRVDPSVKDILYKYFDEQLPCQMIIDTNFKKAYAPQYHGCMATDGDLASEASCMSGRGEQAQSFYGKINGCKVARFETSDGQQVGRCIVYEYNGKRHFIRIYGNGSYHRTMINLIKDNMKPDDLFGRSYVIKNLRLDADWDDDTPNMYLDGDYYGICYDGENWTVVANDFNFDAKSTSSSSLGCVYNDCDDDYYRCDCCGARVHADDVYWCGDNTYCSKSCAQEDGWEWCSWCDEAIWRDDAIYAENGNYYCREHCANRDEIHQCPCCKRWVNEEDLYSTEDGGMTMCKDCLDDDENLDLDTNGYIVNIKDEEEHNDE